jgi:HPt (histidine-containing phosphotransfer) domain-containing protein
MNGSPLDPDVLAELRALSGPDDDLLAEVVAVFLADAPEQMRAMRAALEGRDAALAHRAAHTLKGSANAVGARALGGVAAAIESAARAGDIDRAVEAAQGIDDAFDAARAALEREIGRA